MTSAQFLAAAAGLSQDELRALVRTLSVEERAVSDRRLALHALIDRVRTELIALSHESAAGRTPRRARAASEAELRAWAERAVLAREPGSGLDRFSAADVARLLRLLREAEIEISERRRELHDRIDALHEELLGRLQRRVEREV
ncbi:hypothetical protein Gocc_0411 [Gaiella occulta]|uniref:Uncharacterized protein n=1 Tax=Gaiella occulta TaxID=1002870 RepID=A0A7M2Z282_9ACTN|nr:hypothetical protein [Gaiella occulta]RDI75992.1 hypothetical protein Gocc_0411 [Gaiella occulta]